MPKVKTKKGFRYFPYTKAGKKAAEKLRYKLRKKKQGYKAREDESLGMRNSLLRNNLKELEEMSPMVHGANESRSLND